MENTNPFLNVDLDFSTPVDEIRWEQFISEITRGNVIPVIGPEFLSANEQNTHKQLLDLFANKLGISSSLESFSQLVYNPKFPQPAGLKKGEYIYEMIDKALCQVSILAPSELLTRLLGTRKFPFVITTSFTPIVENVMKNIYGKVRVLKFSNNPSEDMRVGVGDIASAKELEEPTVLYMFGKHNMTPHSFAVTDWDMISFCRSWLTTDGTPRTLHNIIKSRHLLMLGNNYSDWLFRFIISSMFDSKDDMHLSMMVNSTEDSPLTEFLTRLEFFIKCDPKSAVNEIIDRISRRNQMAIKNEEEKHDVFLSYSRADQAYVRKLRNALLNEGLSVWMDEGNIPVFEDWKRTMLSAIGKSRVFVPVLTLNIEKEYMSPHEYRTEWDEAVSMAQKMGARPFILPVTEEGFGFYDQTKLPLKFKELNTGWFTKSDNCQSLAKAIAAKVQEVKQIESGDHGK